MNLLNNITSKFENGERKLAKNKTEEFRKEEEYNKVVNRNCNEKQQHKRSKENEKKIFQAPKRVCLLCAGVELVHWKHCSFASRI